MAGSGISAKPSEAMEVSIEGFVAESEEHDLSRAAGLQQRRDNRTCCLCKVALGRHLGAEIGEGLHGSAEAAEITFLHCHA